MLSPPTPHILIVDDEPAICDYLKQFLDGQAYAAATVNSGRDAIRQVAATHFDIIFLDIGLPDVGGYDVMDHIGRLSPHSLIILMTGYASIESAVEALRKGPTTTCASPLISRNC